MQSDKGYHVVKKCNGMGEEEKIRKEQTRR